MIATVFRSHIRPNAVEEYVRHKDFIAEDGERVTIVEFESEDAQLAFKIEVCSERRTRTFGIASRRAQAEADVAA